MVKKVFFAAAVAVAVAGVSVTAAPTEVLASKTGCFKKAKAKYGLHLIKRHAYRKECRARYKA
jgi:hypothetical protein